MDRLLEKQLLEWKEHPQHLPLLLRGARQVGKTFIVEKLAQAHFKNLVTINFELQPQHSQCFETLEPAEIIKTITFLTKQSIVSGETLLFLDEIQECPNAIRALRYFKEQIPQLHVIGAGSLLEFTLNDPDFRMPVGRVQFMYLRPVSFKEFLLAAGNTELNTHLEQITLDSPVAEPVHNYLLKLLRDYLMLGGMPAVLQEYFASQNLNMCQNLQTALLATYRKDFGKYAPITNHIHLQQLFIKAPTLVGQNFKYVNVDPELRSRDIKSALEKLRDAGLIHLVYATAASGLPLNALINEKKFKLLLLDVGLLNCITQLSADILLNQDIMLLNRGAIAEQFVGQELLAYSNPFTESELFFWLREQKSSTAEVDFVITVDSQIIPVEVKAGVTGRLKSLRIFMEEKKSNFGIRISQNKLEFSDNILSVPLYLISEIPRLVKELRHKIIS